MKLNPLAAIASCAAATLLMASAAAATTVDFSYDLAGVPQASGSFSYATGDTGVLGYSDLSSFDVTVAGVTYDLAEAEALPNYNYFAYDTTAGQFVDNPNACGTDGCGYDETLGAISNNYSSGFFFESAANGEYEEYSQLVLGSFDTISYSVGTAAVPEPATWLLMMLGIGGIGVAFRQAKRNHGFRFKDAFAA